jgi:hypothetical protein
MSVLAEVIRDAVVSMDPIALIVTALAAKGMATDREPVTAAHSLMGLVDSARAQPGKYAVVVRDGQDVQFRDHNIQHNKFRS